MTYSGLLGGQLEEGEMRERERRRDRGAREGGKEVEGERKGE